MGRKKKGSFFPGGEGGSAWGGVAETGNAGKGTNPLREGKKACRSQEKREKGGLPRGEGGSGNHKKKEKDWLLPSKRAGAPQQKKKIRTI